MNIAHSRRSRVTHLDRPPEDLPVQAIDLCVLSDQVLGELDVAPGERQLGLGDLRAGQATHPLDRVEDVLVLGRLVTGQWHELGDVDALVAHPLHAANHVQQRGDDAQVPRHRRLAGQQGQDPLVHLEVTAVDPGVVGDDHAGQLDVLVGEGLQRAVELLDHEVESVECLALELGQFFMEPLGRLRHTPTV
jgi:hypothetical protein